MKIKKLSASFGKLCGDTLELSDGLNIVCAPNESGKSTWCAFIRTMLYGLNTSDRDKSGYLSDKSKYRPWNDKPMEGSMDITYNGQNITLQRASLGKAPMKSFSAVITDTDIAVKELTSENVGLALTGVTKPVFERSAFIRQSGIHVSQTGELEKCIASIVSSGDETVSYTEADEKLRAWTRRRKSRTNTGTIPTIQAQIREKQDTLDRIRRDCEESARLRAEQNRLLAEKELLQRELEAHEVLKELENRKNLEKLRRDAAEKELKVKSVSSKLEAFGSTDDELLNGLRADLSTLDSLFAMEHAASEKCDSLKARYDAAKAAADSSPFCTITPAEADNLCQNAQQLEDDIQKRTKRSKLLTIVLSALAALLAAAGIFTKLPVNLILWITAVLCIAGAAFSGSSCKKVKKQLSELLEKYGMADVSLLRKACEAYSLLRSEEDISRAEYLAGSNARSSAENAYNDHLRAMLDKAHSVSSDIQSEADLDAVLNRIADLKRDYAKLRTQSDMALALYNAKETGEPLSEIKEPDLIPRHERSRTQAALNETVRRIENTNAAYNMTLGRLRVLGDPMILEGEIRTLTEALDEQTSQYAALCLACEALAEADNEIHTRFAPVLSKTAGTVFNRITDGKYDMLAFNKALDAAAQAKGETVSKNVLYLSEGTADQIYLSLRIAVCLLALPKENPCPMILDDALASFDDKRMSLALSYLKELSAERQIILFTCHSREAQYFAGDPEVNIVSL